MHTLGGGYLEMSGRYSLASSTSLGKVSAYLRGGGSASAVRAVVYGDAGNRPGVFVAVSEPVTVAAGQAAGWVDFPVSGSPTLAAGQYWLGLWSAATSVLGSYASVPGSGFYAPAPFSASGSPPASWPGGGSGDSLSYSVYATLGAGASAPVPSNTGLPAITGAPSEGQQLTASTGVWTDSPTGYAYQWQRCNSSGASCVPVGAGSASYLLVSGDVGSTIRVAVTASNAAGSSAPATSAPTAVVQSAVSGGTIGVTSVGGSTHTLGGGYLEVSGRYTLASSASVSKLTAYLQGGGSATGMRAVVYADTGSNRPGAFVAVSQPVTIAAGQPAGWVDFPVSGAPALPAGQYWLGLWSAGTSARGFYENVSGGGSYAPATYSSGANPPASWPGGGSGDNLAYSLYATLGGGSATVPSNTALPSIGGTASEGQQLTASTGTWAESPTGFAYQWQRCNSGGASCVPVGAGSASYLLVSGDVGSTIRVAVTASNAAGSSAPATSPPTAVVQSAASGGTLGVTSVGGSTHTLGGGYLEVSGRYVLGSAGSVSKLTAYLQGGGSATGMRAVVYADSGSNRPGSVRGCVAAGDGRCGAGGGLGRFSGVWVAGVGGGPVLVGFVEWGDERAGLLRQRVWGRLLCAATYSSSASPPASWPGGGSGDSLAYSLYATLG